ncbi:pyruvate oxidase [Gracilibacillus boraciitolerans JCM 21714]|uniref:Pyruvate oxidase n=1 Tax=Gracilibacillus boraciitolerans JCM 21714 TaxID=1298598 RepID=W4VN28_9BACI|nr:pyruvate oxidase [Gracilibacillus boraciitolerans JCM 21714]
MVMQDFLTAVKYQLPMTIIILNNEKLGMIKYEQELIGNIPYETDLENVNFGKFAITCGGNGFHVNSVEELEAALKAAKNQQLPTIIDVEIEDRAPLPGKIEWDQAFSYSKHLWKKLVENEREWDMPPLKTILKRLF